MIYVDINLMSNQKHGKTQDPLWVFNLPIGTGVLISMRVWETLIFPDESPT
jgi:hypothetical protein